MENNKSIKIVEIDPKHLVDMSIIDLISMLENNSSTFYELFQEEKLGRKSVFVQASNVKKIESTILMKIAELESPDSIGIFKYSKSLSKEDRKKFEMYLLKAVGSNIGDLMLKIFFK